MASGKDLASLFVPFERGDFVARKTRRLHSVVGGIALENQPMSATQDMLPILPMQFVRIVKKKHIVVPRPRISRAMNWSELCCIPAVTKLRVISLSTQGAVNPQHRVTA